MLMMDAPLHERQRTARHHHCCCTLTVQQWPSLWRDILRLFASLLVAIWLRISFLIAAALAPASWHPHPSCAASGAPDAPHVLDSRPRPPCSIASCLASSAQSRQERTAAARKSESHCSWPLRQANLLAKECPARGVPGSAAAKSSIVTTAVARAVSSFAVCGTSGVARRRTMTQ